MVVKHFHLLIRKRKRQLGFFPSDTGCKILFGRLKVPWPRWPEIRRQDIDNLIEYFRDPERRKEFFKKYKEMEMLYEIISPDAFLRPFIDQYATLSAIYDVVRNAYAKKVYVDRAFHKKTNELAQQHVGTDHVANVCGFVTIDEKTIDLIKQQKSGDGTKVINLVALRNIACSGLGNRCSIG